MAKNPQEPSLDDLEDQLLSTLDSLVKSTSERMSYTQETEEKGFIDRIRRVASEQESVLKKLKEDFLIKSSDEQKSLRKKKKTTGPAEYYTNQESLDRYIEKEKQNTDQSKRNLAMTIKSYLHNKTSWISVQRAYNAYMKAYKDDAKKKTAFLESTACHFYTEAKAIQQQHKYLKFDNTHSDKIRERLITQIAAYIQKGNPNKDKIEVMKALKDYLNGEKTWEAVQKVIASNPSYNSKYYYSQVEATYKTIANLKDRLFEIKQPQTGKPDLDTVKDKQLDELTYLSFDFLPKYANVLTQNFDNLDRNAQLAYRSQEVIRTIQQYFEGEISWIRVRYLRDLYKANWHEIPHSKKLDEMITEIERGIPSAKKANEAYQGLINIENYMRKDPKEDFGIRETAYEVLDELKTATELTSVPPKLNRTIQSTFEKELTAFVEAVQTKPFKQDDSLQYN